MKTGIGQGTEWEPSGRDPECSYLSDPDTGSPEVGRAQAVSSVFAFIGPDVTIPVTNLELPALPTGWVLNGSVSWSAFIDYTDHGRNDTSATLTGTSAVWSPIPIDFAGIVQGGTIHFHVQADIKNSTTGATDTRKLDGTNAIRGQNPTKDTVKSRLGDIALQVIAYIESIFTFNQFDGSGLPLFGAPNGFGVMQLDNSPTPTAREIWDWQQNVDGGKGKYSDGQTVVRQHYKNLRTAHPTLPDLTDAELHLADYAAYNAGTGSQDRFYWQPNAAFNGWIKNTNTAFTQYADKAIGIEQNVAAGSPPAGW